MPCQSATTVTECRNFSPVAALFQRLEHSERKDRRGGNQKLRAKDQNLSAGSPAEACAKSSAHFESVSSRQRPHSTRWTSTIAIVSSSQ